MMKEDQFKNLVQVFADSVIGQDEAIRVGDAKMSNIFGRRYIRAAKELLRSDEGIKEFEQVLSDPRLSVRAAAATYLLPHKTEQAILVLEEAARGRDVAAFGALTTLARWKGGERKMWEEIERVSNNARLPKPRKDWTQPE